MSATIGRAIIIMVIILALFLSACSGHEAKYAAEMESVQKLVDDGNYEYALNALRSLKTTYADEEEIDQAIEEVQKLIDIENSAEAYQKALELSESGDYINAYNSFKLVIEEDKENYAASQSKLEEIADATFEQMVGFAKQGAEDKNFTAAVKWARDALAMRPDNEVEKLLAKYEEEAEKAEAAARRERIIESMQTYERGSGDIGIACQTKKTTRFNDGFTTYTAGKGAILLHVWLSAMNYGNETVHVNPTFVTISTPDGQTFNPNTETTYSLSNYFDAIDLPPDGKSSGWLIFYVPEADEYTLHYNGLFEQVDKDIIVME